MFKIQLIKREKHKKKKDSIKHTWETHKWKTQSIRKTKATVNILLYVLNDAITHLTKDTVNIL